MSILTEIQKTAANADEKIKHLYELIKTYKRL